jgi:hypothetical protein
MAQLTVSRGRKIPRVVQGGQKPVEEHLQNLDNGGDHSDVGEQAEKGQVQAGWPIQARAPGLSRWLKDQVVDRDGDDHQDQHRRPQADGALYLFRYGEKGAHAEKKTERQVFDEEMSG